MVVGVPFGARFHVFEGRRLEIKIDRFFYCAARRVACRGYRYYKLDLISVEFGVLSAGAGGGEPAHFSVHS